MDCTCNSEFGWMCDGHHVTAQDRLWNVIEPRLNRQDNPMRADLDFALAQFEMLDTGGMA